MTDSVPPMLDVMVKVTGTPERVQAQVGGIWTVNGARRCAPGAPTCASVLATGPGASAVSLKVVVNAPP